MAPLRGKVVDRYGTAALLLSAGGYTVALGVLLLGAIASWPSVLLVCLAGATGAMAPPLIASARALWPLIAGRELTRASHALNALIGDAATVVGPLATGALAVSLGPAAAFGALGAGPMVGSLLVASIGVPRHTRPAARSHVSAIRSPGLRTILGAGVPLGLALGALDVAAPALAAREGAPALAAVPLAAFAAGSVMSSLWAGQSTRAGTPQRRYVVGFGLFALALGGALVARSIPSLSAVLLMAGLAYGLLNVGLFELLDEVVPARNAVEALTWVTSAEGLGLAAGSAIAGVLATRSVGAALAFVALASPVGAALIIQRRRTLRPIQLSGSND